MSDDLPETTCDDCDLRFTVIWNNDWETQRRRTAGEPVIEFCPRCGERLPESEASDE